MDRTITWTLSKEEDRSEIGDDLVRLVMADQGKKSIRDARRRAVRREWCMPFIWGLAAIGAVFAIALFEAIRGSSGPHLAWAVVLFVGACGVAYGIWGHFRSQRFYGEFWQQTRQYATLVSSTLRVGSEVSVGPDGIRMRGSDLEFFVAWTWPRRVVVDKGGILIIGEGAATIFMASRGLQDGVTHAQAVETINAYYEASGRSDVARITECLRGRDFRCENCKYNLRNASSAFCPECGFRINVLEVEAATENSIRVLGRDS
jgi:hypothetical protein